MNLATKMKLPSQRRRLVELMQDINFGRIENVFVRNGEPQLEMNLSVVREVKIGGENGVRPERHTGDFALKSQVIELFEHLDHIRDCHIESLEIKHGLPFRMLIRETAA
jgi:hypothetical protein